MKISKLHSRDELGVSTQVCTPCDTATRPGEASCWPEMWMSRRHVAEEVDERLSICIRNPWPGLVLQGVKITFLTATPATCLGNGEEAVKLAPSHGIDFGDIYYSAKKAAEASVRDIILLDGQPQERNRQFYAGVCFNAVSEDGRQVTNHCYVLFKSGCLPQFTSGIHYS